MVVVDEVAVAVNEYASHHDGDACNGDDAGGMVMAALAAVAGAAAEK